MDEFVDLERGFHRVPMVTIQTTLARLNVTAWRAIGEPSHVRIKVNRATPEVVKIVPASGDEPNVMAVRGNQEIGSMLRTYVQHGGYRPGKYPATVDGDALVIRLETAA